MNSFFFTKKFIAFIIAYHLFWAIILGICLFFEFKIVELLVWIYMLTISPLLSPVVFWNLFIDDFLTLLIISSISFCLIIGLIVDLIVFVKRKFIKQLKVVLEKDFLYILQGLFMSREKTTQKVHLLGLQKFPVFVIRTQKHSNCRKFCDSSKKGKS